MREDIPLKDWWRKGEHKESGTVTRERQSFSILIGNRELSEERKHPDLQDLLDESENLLSKTL